MHEVAENPRALERDFRAVVNAQLGVHVVAEGALSGILVRDLVCIKVVLE